MRFPDYIALAVLIVLIVWAVAGFREANYDRRVSATPRNKSGSFAIFTAIRRASSLLSSLASMAALPPKADVVGRECDVRFVPEADPCTAARKPVIRSRPRVMASRYVSAILMIGRGLPTGGLEGSCPSKISVRPTRSYSAEIVSSQ